MNRTFLWNVLSKKHMELKAVCLLCSLNGVIKIVKMLEIKQ